MTRTAAANDALAALIRELSAQDATPATAPGITPQAARRTATTIPTPYCADTASQAAGSLPEHVLSPGSRENGGKSGGAVRTRLVTRNAPEAAPDAVGLGPVASNFVDRTGGGHPADAGGLRRSGAAAADDAATVTFDPSIHRAGSCYHFDLDRPVPEHLIYRGGTVCVDRLEVYERLEERYGFQCQPDGTILDEWGDPVSEEKLRETALDIAKGE